MKVSPFVYRMLGYGIPILWGIGSVVGMAFALNYALMEYPKHTAPWLPLLFFLGILIIFTGRTIIEKLFQRFIKLR
mgnify:CR=1 FL=1